MQISTDKKLIIASHSMFGSVKLWETADADNKKKRTLECAPSLFTRVLAYIPDMSLDNGTLAVLARPNTSLRTQITDRIAILDPVSAFWTLGYQPTIFPLADYAQEIQNAESKLAIRKHLLSFSIPTSIMASIFVGMCTDLREELLMSSFIFFFLFLFRVFLEKSNYLRNQQLQISKDKKLIIASHSMFGSVKLWETADAYNKKKRTLECAPSLFTRVLAYIPDMSLDNGTLAVLARPNTSLRTQITDRIAILDPVSAFWTVGYHPTIFAFADYAQEIQNAESKLAIRKHLLSFSIPISIMASLFVGMCTDLLEELFMSSFIFFFLFLFRVFLEKSNYLKSAY